MLNVYEVSSKDFVMSLIRVLSLVSECVTLHVPKCLEYFNPRKACVIIQARKQYIYNIFMAY